MALRHGYHPKVAEKVVMLRLLTDKGGLDNPTIPLRWCIDPSDRAKLLEVKATQVQVLITVAYENGAEDRQLRPFEEAMTYVGFRFPGKHLIFARLIWPYSNQMKKLRKEVLSRRNSRYYEEDILDADRTEIKEYFSSVPFGASKLPQADPLEVEVDKGHFAAEPSQWLQRYVNLWFDFAPVDQCAFRRRMIGAFTYQLIVMLFWWTVKAVVRMAVFLGSALVVARDLDWRQVFLGDIDEIWPTVYMPQYGFKRPLIHMRSAWSVQRADGKWVPFRLLISPAAFLLYFATIHIVHERLDIGYLSALMVVLWAPAKFFFQLALELKLLGWVLLVKIGLTLGAILVASVAVVALSIWLGLRQLEYQKTAEYKSEQKRLAEERAERSINDAYRYLTCPTSAEASYAATLKALPPERRTLRLRYYETKRAICRPFAG